MLENYEIKCACGCGKTLLKYSKWGDPRNFINGHNRRLQPSAKGFLGKKHTEESKRLMSEALKRAYQNKPELREMRSKKHKGKIVSEKSRLKESISQKEYFRNHPEARLKRSIQAKSRMGIKNPFFGKKHNQITKDKIRASMTAEMNRDDRRTRNREHRLNQIIPKKDTFIEKAMENELIKQGIVFKKHVNLLNRYQVDFLIENIIVECDGMYWHNYPYGLDKDHIRDKKLEDNGFKTFRFWGKEIRSNVSQCVDKIKENLTCRSV